MGDSNCYKCGKPGHWARECYTKIKRDAYHFVADKEVIKNKVTRCFLCRKLGHLARECPSGEGKYFDLDRPVESIRRSDAAPPPPPFNTGGHSYAEMDGTAITEAFESIDERDWDFMKNENSKELPAHQSGSDHKLGNFKQDSKYCKTVYLGNIKFNGFLDTCSENCLIKYSAAKRARLNVQLDDTDVMLHSPTFKHKMVSIGKATTTMCVDSVEVSNVDLFVVNDEVLNSDIVVGRSWLDHPHVMLLKMENTVYLADITVHPFDKFRSILSSLDIKPTGKKPAIESRLDLISSSDDESHGKGNKNDNNVAKKRRRSNSKTNYKEIHEHNPRKPSREFGYERERGLLRGRSRERIIRSRSRERVREPLRDERMPKLIERSRRSRERSRSRDRYLSRHSGRH